MASGAILRLALENYRNHRSFSLECDAPFVVLTGHNGAGKTNVLEAISYLSPGRGLRGSSGADVVSFGGNAPWTVSSLVQRDGWRTSISLVGDKNGRRSRVDGLPTRSSSDLTSMIRLTWLSPSMDTLLNGSGTARRRFWDRFVANIESGHSSRLNEFDRLMRERFQLLQWRADNVKWIETVEQRMAEVAVALTYSRLDAIRILDVELARLHEVIYTPAPKIDVGFHGNLADLAAQSAATDVETWYIEQLRSSREVDLRSGRLTYGPQRDDLTVVDQDSRLAAAYCSTGQRKSMLLVLVLAQAAVLAQSRSVASLLLLDEVSAHLDEARRDSLFDLLARLDSQVWLTGTEKELFSSLPDESVHCLVG